MAHLLLGAIEYHDLSQFEAHGYSCGPDDGTEYRKRCENAFLPSVNLQNVSNIQAVTLIKQNAVNILIWLT